MVDIPSLEDEAKQRAVDYVTRLLEVPENLEKLDMLRMKAQRQCEATDAQLKAAMQSQLEDVKSGLQQLNACIELNKEVDINFAEMRALYKSVAAKAAELDAMRPVADKRGRLAKTLEHIRHVVKVEENIRKIEAFISDDKLLNAHKLLSELEVSRDEVMYSLAKEPTASVDDLAMIENYFAPVEQQTRQLEKRIVNYMSRLIATCKANPVIVVSCLRVVEREEVLDLEYEARCREDSSYKCAARPKKWREVLVLCPIEDTVKERIYGLQTETRETKTFWLSLYLENVLRQLTHDVIDVQNVCVACFPPKYQILENFIKWYHSAIAERLLELYEEGMQDKECLSLLHWIHQRYYGNEGLSSTKLKLPVELLDSLEALLPDEIVDQCQKCYLDSTKANIASWLGTCLEKNVECWRGPHKPDLDRDGIARTNIPIDVFQMFRETVKEARVTVGPGLTYVILEACVEQLNVLVNDLGSEIRRFSSDYAKTPGTMPHYALYNIAVANSCDMFKRFLADMIADYQDVIVEVQHTNPFGATLLNKVELANEAMQVLPDTIVSLLCDVVLRDLTQVLRYVLTRDKWFNSSMRCGTICGTVEDYWQEAFVHLQPGHYRRLINMLQERIVAQYLNAMTSPPMKPREDEFGAYADKLREDADTFCGFFESIEVSDSSSGGPVESPFFIFDTIADLLATPIDSDSLSLVLASFVKKYPDVPERLLVSLVVLRGVPRSEATSYAGDAKNAFLPSSNRNPSASRFRRVFSLMEQPLPSGQTATSKEGTLAGKLAQVVSG